MCILSSYFHPAVSEDRMSPVGNQVSRQPFINQGDKNAGARFVFQMSSAEVLSAEQIAYALSQVTAANVLPPLLPLACGTDLLEYQVWLREHLEGALVDELAAVLAASWRDLGWEQLGSAVFLGVIGAGVAACLDLTPGAEQLYLRYASDLEHALYLAGRTLDLPRSRLFLQAALYEKVDGIFAYVRARTWNWLVG